MVHRVGKGMSSSAVIVPRHAAWEVRRSAAWPRAYARQVVGADFGVAALAAMATIGLRFGVHANVKYLVLSAVMPALWVIGLRLVGGYEMKFFRYWLG